MIAWGASLSNTIDIEAMLSPFIGRLVAKLFIFLGEFPFGVATDNIDT